MINSNSRLASPNFLIFFLIFFITVAWIIIAIKPLSTSAASGTPSALLPDDYYQNREQWSSTDPSDVTIITKNRNKEVTLPGTSICTLYLYQNNFNIFTKPNLNTVFEDVYQGLAHPLGTQIPSCLESNQILAYNGEHTCNTDENNQCINSFGNTLNKGQSENYTVNCGENIPSCAGNLASISFNFQFNAVNTLNINTKFLTINSIIASKKDYARLKEEDGYYFKTGLFLEDSTGQLTEGNYRPNFTYEDYQNSSVRQLFKIIKYNYDASKGMWKEDDSGLFMTIQFLAINSYLSVDNEGKFIFKEISNIPLEDTIEWLTIPPLDFKHSIITKNNKFLSGNILNITNDKSSAYHQDLVNSNDSAFFLSNLPRYNDISSGEEVLSLFDLVGNNTFELETSLGSVGVGANNTKSNNMASVLNYKEYPPSGLKYVAQNDGKGNSNNDFYPLIINFNEDSVDDGDVDTSTDTFTFGISPGSQPYPNTNLLGSDVVDNEVVWNVKDIYEGVIVFDDSYFLNTSGDSVEIKQNNSNKVTYPERPITNGLVNISIKVNVLDYNAFQTGKFTVVLNSENTNLKSTDYVNPATVVIFLSPAVDGNNNPFISLDKIDITDRGSNYKSGQKITIKGSAIQASKDIPDLILEAANTTYTYPAYYSSKTLNNYIFNPSQDNLSDLTAYGLYLTQDDINIDSNGNFTVKNGALTLPVIQSGTSYDQYGFGNKFPIYLTQIDQFGRNTSGASFDINNPTTDYKNITDNSIILNLTAVTSGTSFGNNMLPANYSLKRNTNVNRNGDVALDASHLLYNYWGDGPGKYDPSPPQIAYIGMSLKAAARDSISVNSAQGIISFLASDKRNEVNTNIDYIKTLQYRELNYVGYNKSKTQVYETQLNNLGSDSELILGKFIPYRRFQPPVRDGNEAIPTKEGDIIFANNNYTQIIPNGIANIYRTTLEQFQIATL